jgi:hypothetical protein
MKIQSSVDWANVESTLLHIAHSRIKIHSHYQQVYKLTSNIRYLVTKLSKEEVLARRNKSNSATELLVQINNNIVVVMEFILVAALLG